MRRLLPVLVLLTACAQSETTELGLHYDVAAGRIDVTVTRALATGETLHARARRGAVGALKCASAASQIARIDDQPVTGPLPTYAGPTVDATAFLSPYDPSWLTEAEPSPEMLARIAQGPTIIDVCLMKDGAVVKQAELEARRARDGDGTTGKADGVTEERIASTVAYAEKCVAELGDIPFFPRVADGDYGTFDCLDAVPIPTTVTGADGSVDKPAAGVSQCDQPEYIYSLCEGNAVTGRSNGPRVARQDNDQGTSWVLLCRKAQPTEGQYNDIAMIGHNPFTGKTCFFQNALYSRTDGRHVPHPGDKVASTGSPQQSETLWEGIHGGIGSGIECAHCHDADPFIHSPWIDQARNADGTHVVPRMGEHPNFALGFNNAPYAIVNTAGQGWTMPKQVTAPEAAACTRCHRIGDGMWMQSYLARMNGSDESWKSITTEAYRKFEHAFWMPPDADGLDEASFPASDYGKAMTFIIGCNENPAACQPKPLPTAEVADDGGLPAIDLHGPALAGGALAVLGADIHDATCPGGQCATRRCAECHSLSRSGLKRWLNLTQAAWSTCNLKKDAGDMTQAEAKTAVDCLRVDPRDATSPYESAKLGVLAAGVQYGPFQRLFRKAFGEGTWLVEYNRFKARVGMPKGNHPTLTQKEFAILSTWFQGSLNDLDAELPEAPPPATCTDSLDAAALGAHADEMKLEGWSAVNQDNGLRMFGCASDSALECFGGQPDRTATWGGDVGTIRELKQLGFRTSYWTRSSADGRFVGNGGGSAGATISDLQAGTDIAVHASYDPGFFPDNSGFIFQGSVGGAGICRQSLLEHDADVDFSEPECIKASGINLYQHVARGLGGSGDYFIINSQFVSDSGSGTTDPAASFNASSTIKLTPMVFDGEHYQQQAAIIVDSPYEGDSVLSPSMQLVSSRLAGPDGKSLGYVIRRVVANRFGASYQISTDEKLATICTPGAKPNFSFDERFMVIHHYDGTGASNLVLIDLRDGSKHQLTHMPAGLKALYPHFRSDGWIYFLIKGGAHDTLAATDAALRIP